MQIKRVPQAVFDRITCNGAYAPRPTHMVMNKNRKTGQVRTIVHFEDGTKTIVANCKTDRHDPEKALYAAILKRTYGKVVVNSEGGVDVVGNGYGEMLRKVTEKAVDQNLKAEQAAQRKAEKQGCPRFQPKRRGKGGVKRCVRPATRPSGPFSKMTPDQKRQYWRWVKQHKTN